MQNARAAPRGIKRKPPICYLLSMFQLLESLDWPAYFHQIVRRPTLFPELASASFSMIFNLRATIDEAISQQCSRRYAKQFIQYVNESLAEARQLAHERGNWDPNIRCESDWKLNAHQDPSEALQKLLPLLQQAVSVTAEELKPFKDQRECAQQFLMQELQHSTAGMLSSTSCGWHRQTSIEHNFIFSVEVPRQKKSISVQQLADNQFVNYPVEDFFCDHCHTKHTVDKKIELRRVGRYFMMLFRRYANDGRKNYTRIDVRRGLKLLGHQYRAIATLNHDGVDLRSGHYTAHRLFNNTWFWIDDDKVFRNAKLQSHLMYIVLFERVPATSSIVNTRAHGVARDAVQLGQSRGPVSDVAELSELNVKLHSLSVEPNVTFTFELLDETNLNINWRKLPKGITKTFLKRLHKHKLKFDEVDVATFWRLHYQQGRVLRSSDIKTWSTQGFRVTFNGKDFVRDIWPQQAQYITPAQISNLRSKNRKRKKQPPAVYHKTSPKTTRGRKRKAKTRHSSASPDTGTSRKKRKLHENAGDAVWACTQCDRVFDSQQSLAVHQRTHRTKPSASRSSTRTSSRSAPSPEPFAPPRNVCYECKTQCESDRALAIHMRVHIEQRRKKTQWERDHYDAEQRKARYERDQRDSRQQRWAETYESIPFIVDLYACMSVDEVQRYVEIDADRARLWVRQVRKLCYTKVRSINKIRAEFLLLLKQCSIAHDHSRRTLAAYHYRQIPIYFLLNISKPETPLEDVDEISAGDSDSAAEDEKPLQTVTRPSVKLRAWLHPDGDVNNIVSDSFAYYNFGPRVIICPHCQALRWPDESAKMCCGSGLVLPFISKLPDPPEEFKWMYDDPHFVRYSVSYNKVFSMTSSGIKRKFPKGKGPPVFIMDGTPCHLIGGLCLDEPDDIGWAQLYLVDPEVALNKRTNIHKKLLKQARFQQNLRRIEAALRQHNPLVREFQYAHKAHREIGLDVDVSLLFVDAKPPAAHPRTWNLPTHQGVCGLLVDFDQLTKQDRYRNIVLRSKDNSLRQIYETNALFNPLQYPLLFPLATRGWKICENKKRNNRRYTARDESRFRCMERLGESNHMHKSGLLWQQYLVESYTKILLQDLRWCRLNQGKLRSAAYQDMKEYVANKSTGAPGRRIILPATTPGSKRYMHNLYCDFLAIARKYGLPDLFITFTCNSKWPEIIEACEGRPSWQRPVIVCRVFRKKLRELRAYIRDGAFGKVDADVMVVEFQKRGLPHAHMLFWLAPEDKPNTPAAVNKIVSAEVPDPVKQPRLHRIVKEHMLHTPCDSTSDTFDEKEEHKCWDDCQHCTKHFPYRYQDATTLPKDGYAQPHRTPPEHGGHVFKWQKKNKETVDVGAEWVVKYNGPLLLMFDAHINVEVCASLRTCKYLCKYLGKGYDYSAFTLTEEQKNDEILVFQTARYLGPYEAAWHIFFQRKRNNPAVLSLALHEPNKASITIDEEYAQTLTKQRLAHLSRTKLTEFFKTNRDEDQQLYDPPSRQIYYQDFPEFYKWMKGKRCWQRRPKRKPGSKLRQIGRLNSISTRQGELWYCRKLLLRTRGATSFDSLKSVPHSMDINRIAATASDDADNGDRTGQPQHGMYIQCSI